MAVRKLRRFNDDSGGVTIPKETLEEEGLLDEEGQIPDDEYVVVERTDEGEWTVRRLDV